MTADTPQAQAVDAQIAEDAATKANLAAQEAIKNSAVLAAASEQASATKVEIIAAKTDERLASQESDLQWLKDHNSQTISALQSQAAMTQETRAELQTVRQSQTQLAEQLTALAALLTPKPQEEPVAVVPPEKPQNEGGVDQKEAKTLAQKRVFRRI